MYAWLMCTYLYSYAYIHTIITHCYSVHICVHTYILVLTHNYTIIHHINIHSIHIHLYTVIPNLQATEADEELFEDNPTDYIRKDMEGSDIGKMGVYVCVCVYFVLFIVLL